jgi:hypothetical protein
MISNTKYVNPVCCDRNDTDVESYDLLIYSKCYECGYIGESRASNFLRKVICESCDTINDFWLEGEQPPLSHIVALSKWNNRGNK